MKDSSDTDNPTVITMKKSICDAFDTSPKHKKAIKSICIGDTAESLRLNVNRRIRATIALSTSPQTNKKLLALDSLDCNSSVDEWMKDFTRTVVPYVVNKIDPAELCL